MKYVIVLGDGMADWPIDSLNGKTCLEAALTPNLDKLAQRAQIGLCKTVPDGLKPGSDVANMAVLGFDPLKYYTGRSPIEAVSMGIELDESDVTYRCNLVTLSNEQSYADRTMLDYSAGEPTEAETEAVIRSLKELTDSEDITLYKGVSYRHCLVVKGGKTGSILTPPHDITDKKIAGHLPEGEHADKFNKLMVESSLMLAQHPVNCERRKAGKKEISSIWLWGEGTKPGLYDFEGERKLKGGIISAVDLIKGLGTLAGMEVIKVDGITGNYDTDFAAKANAALDALLGGLDLVYIHVEAPDECGHHGDTAHKIYSIEQIDGQIVGTLLKKFEEANEDFAMLVCPDHPTPVAIKTHTSDPVPYLIYTNVKDMGNGADGYSEREAKKTGAYVADGYKLIDELLKIK